MNNLTPPAVRTVLLAVLAAPLVLAPPSAVAQTGDSTLPYHNGMAAKVVIGQPDFTSGAVNQGGSPGGNTLRSNAQTLVVNGKLLIADAQNNRVLVFNQVPATNNAFADVVIGQQDFTSVTENQGAVGTVGVPTARTLDRPSGLATDGQRLFILDRDNHRVLIYNAVPTANNAAADVVIGHGTMGENSFCGDSLSNNTAGLAATCFSSAPTGLVYDPPSGKLVVYDSDNNRVLIYNSVPTVNGAAADVVVGQADFAHNAANQGGPVGARTLNLSTASGVGTYNGKLLIGDRLNNRVLIFNQIPTANNAAADVVIGQADFTHNSANQGGAVSAQGLDGPRGVHVDSGGRLFVPEAGNARVLVFAQIPTANNASADVVIGQPDFTTITPGTTDRKLQTFPYHVSFFQDHFVVSDGTNHRVLIFENDVVETAPTISAIADQTTIEDTPTAALPFTVGDVETAAASLTVTGSSSNPALVPLANLTFGGSGASRTVTVTPAAHAVGLATITLTVSDGSQSTGTSFLLRVRRRWVRGDFTGDGHADRAVYRPGTGTWVIDGLTDIQFGLPGDIPVPGDYNGDATIDVAVYRPASGQWFIRDQPVIQWGLAGDIPVPADYNGDGTMDAAVFRTVGGPFATWYIQGQGPVLFGVRGDIPVPADYDGDGLADLAVYRPATGTWYVATAAGGFAATTSVQFGLAGDVPVPGDYDGDGQTDPAVFRPATGAWYVSLSATDTVAAVMLGAAGDDPLALDLDGNGVDELCAVRPSTGAWQCHNRVTGTTTSQVLGATGDIPAARRPRVTAPPPTDFDGDHRSDLTVFRPGSGTWFTRLSATDFGTFTSLQWGLAGDLRVPGDYDGDRRADLAVFRPSTGVWYLRFSGTGFATSRAEQWGLSTDVPVPADYDGDGRTDLAVYRPSSGSWYVRYSSSDYATSSVGQWGLSSDVPVPADYDGDGRADLAVFRPSSGEWYLNLSSGAFGGGVVRQWGLPSDTPLTGDFDGDGRSDLAVFRPSNGLWYVMDALDGTTHPVRQWGLSGDIPLAHDFDGDGVIDVAVFRPNGSTWFVLRSSGGVAVIQWGVPDDIPMLRHDPR